MIALIVGNIGAGKSLLLTIIGMLELEANKTVYSTYHISYTFKGKDGKERKIYFVDVTDLLQWFQEQNKEFVENTGALLIDEAYGGTDSRTSSSLANRLLSHFVFQSRKLGLDLYVACQLASSIDKRIRNLADTIILAEIQWRNITDSNDNILQQIKDFKYTWATADGESGEWELSNEKAREIFPYYSTMEIVQPPMMVLDKRVSKQVKESGIRKGKQIHKKQPSEINVIPRLPEQPPRKRLKKQI